MTVTKTEFIETACKWFKRLLEKELPEMNKEGQPFFENEYMNEAWRILLDHICHVRSAFGGHE
jgi:hypothetical protein